MLARVLLHVLAECCMALARVIVHKLARALPHVLARVLVHVLARVIIHVHNYYSKTCHPVDLPSMQPSSPPSPPPPPPPSSPPSHEFLQFLLLFSITLFQIFFNPQTLATLFARIMHKKNRKKRPTFISIQFYAFFCPRNRQ